MTDINYSKFTVTRPGGTPSNIASWSHFNDAVPQGQSRLWGGAPADTQKQAIDAIIGSAQKQGLTTHETAHALAIANVESGFNPQAAAGTSSATGLGQFIDKTGNAYGLNDSNRWDTQAQADALVQHFRDNRDLANKRGVGEEYIYKFHHDGPVENHGGLEISQQKVMPLLNKYEAALKGTGNQNAAPSPQANPPSQTQQQPSPPPDNPPPSGDKGDFKEGSSTQQTASGDQPTAQQEQQTASSQSGSSGDQTQNQPPQQTAAASSTDDTEASDYPPVDDQTAQRLASLPDLPPVGTPITQAFADISNDDTPVPFAAMSQALTDMGGEPPPPSLLGGDGATGAFA